MKRLIEQTACDHGELEPHVWFTEKQRLARECPGGTSREVEIDYEAAKDTAWSVLSFDELGDDEAVALVHDIVDAALKEGSE